MDSKLRHTARWVADAAGTGLVYLVGSFLSLDLHILAALVATTLIVALLISENAPRWLAIFSLSVVLAVILPAGILTQTPPKVPSTDDLTLNFVPEKAEGSSVFGHVTVENHSRETLHFLDWYLAVSSSYVQNDTKGDRIVAPNSSTEFAVDRKNDLAERGGDILLEFHCAFGESSQARQEAKAVFSVPLHAVFGHAIPPKSCCKPSGKDMLLTGASDAEWRLDQDDSYIEFPGLPEIDGEGNPMNIYVFRSRRRFAVNAKERLVYLGILKSRGWLDLVLPLPETENGEHYIKASWKDATGVSYLIVDDTVLAGDANTGKIVRLPVSKLEAK